MFFYSNLLNFIILMIMILVSISFFTLFERKLLSYLQLRKGPNKVGLIGVLQSFSDGLKLFSNEFFSLYQFSHFYYLSPLMMFIISYLMWIFYPFMMNLFYMKYMMLVIFCLLSVNVYPLMFAGIFSNSLYSKLGGLRSIAQTISYEVSFFFLIFSFLLLIESLDLIKIFYLSNLAIFMFPLLVIFYLSMLAELNRTPFDFSEGESELISGFNIEYMSGGFTLIFLSEYSNIMFLSLIFMMLSFIHSVIFYLFLLYLVIMIRALMPRFRFDKLMFMIWLHYLPISMNYLIYLMLFKYLMMS